jgi:arylformamidase
MNFKNPIDISMSLNEQTLVWIEDDQPELKKVARQPEAPVNFTWLSFGAHAGTHVDAPYYLFSDKWTADQIPLSRLMGKCQILDLTNVEKEITADHLKSKKISQDKILLKTKNSFDPLTEFHQQHISLSKDAAEFLVSLDIKTLGYDYQTFEPGLSKDNIIHNIFLSKDIILIDNLRLKATEEKEYFLMCLPIKVTGIDAAPARAVLFKI